MYIFSITLIGLDWIELNWIGLDWIDWIGLDWIDWMGTRKGPSLQFFCTWGPAVCIWKNIESYNIS